MQILDDARKNAISKNERDLGGILEPKSLEFGFLGKPSKSRIGPTRAQLPQTYLADNSTQTLDKTDQHPYINRREQLVNREPDIFDAIIERNRVVRNAAITTIMSKKDSKSFPEADNAASSPYIDAQTKSLAASPNLPKVYSRDVLNERKPWLKDGGSTSDLKQRSLTNAGLQVLASHRNSSGQNQNSPSNNP